MYQHQFIKQLGQLVIVDILDYYDKPMLVSLKNSLDHNFLAIIIDDNDFAETWLITAISSRRLGQVKNGEIDLRTAFLTSEAGNVLIVRIPYNDDVLAEVINELSIENIPLDYLPPENDKLEIEIKDQIDDIQVATNQINRVILRLHLHFPNMTLREAPISALGKIMVDLQDAINSIGQSLKDIATEIGRIPNTILAQNELNFRTVFNGSFGIELVSSKLPNLWGETEIDVAIEELVELIKIGNGVDPLTEKIKFLKPRVAKNYYDFLGDVEKYLDSADIEWAAPVEGKYNKATITKQIAASARAIIELGVEEPIEYIDLRGELVGLNLRARTFEIKGEEESISGHIPADKVEGFRGIEMGRIYTAVLLRKSSMKLTIGKIEISHELVNLRR